MRSKATSFLLSSSLSDIKLDNLIELDGSVSMTEIMERIFLIQVYWKNETYCGFLKKPGDPVSDLIY